MAQTLARRPSSSGFPVGGSSGTTVSVLQRFESANADGSTVTTADLITTGLGSLPGGAWTANGTGAATTLKVSTAAEVQVGGLQVGGGSGLGDASGTKGISVDFSAALNGRFAQYAFTGISKISFGFALKWSAAFTGGSFNLYDMGALEGSLNYLAVSYEDFSGAQLIRCHTNSGDSTTTISIATNTQYWVTGIYDGPGLIARLRLYTYPSLTQVGSESTQVVTNTTMDRCSCGRYDAHGVSGPGVAFWDDFVIDGVSAIFPLLPT